MTDGRPPARFGSLDAKAAGKRSWEVRRQKEADALEHVGEVSQADVNGIKAALLTKALAGDVQASRELREWLQYSKESGDRPIDILALLTPEQRQVVRGFLAENR